MQDAGAKVKSPLVAAALPEADVEGLVVDQQPDDLAQLGRRRRAAARSRENDEITLQLPSGEALKIAPV
jgi:hypothetical protein